MKPTIPLLYIFIFFAATLAIGGGLFYLIGNERQRMPDCRVKLHGVESRRSVTQSGHDAGLRKRLARRRCCGE